MIEYNINGIIEGTITNIRPYGALMIFENGTRGFLHISQITNSFIKDIFRFLKIGKTYRVKVIDKDDNGFLKVSILQISEEEKDKYFSHNNKKIPVDKDLIDFTALKEHLVQWTKKED